MEQAGEMEAAEKGDVNARPKYEGDASSGSDSFDKKDTAQHLERRTSLA
jgi:hypothetical protein